MRRDHEVLKQILDFANLDDNVKVVIQNGSKVNPNAPVDMMQDYDIAFYLDTYNEIYKEDQSWIKRFGELVMLQQNDSDNDDKWYIFLMQFKDGVRIDLSFHDINKMEKNLEEDSLSKVLLDKDNRVNHSPVPSDESYHIKKPNQKEFEDLLNESWWIQTYVAKGIWRDELPYVKYMFDVILMECISKILSWHIGLNYDWKVNRGKCGKWFNKFLTDELYNEFILVYPNTNYNDIWDSLFKAGKLIRKVAQPLANKLGYHYSFEDDKNVTDFLYRIKALPKDATSF